MLPVYLFYSMFGFQRVGDLLWALGDMRGRGILAGCTAGRTTLLGEGLQHDDGHSPLLASTNPAAAVYDPAFAYEVAVIVEDAIGRMLGPDPEDRFWYLTLYNENYPMPPLPEGPEGDAGARGHRRGPLPLRRPGRTGPATAGSASASRGRCGRRPWRRAGCWPTTGGCRPTPGRPPRGRAPRARRWRPSGGTGSTPVRAPRTPRGHRAPGPRGGPGGRRHRLHAGRARPGGPLGGPAVHLARHRRLRPLRRPGGPAPATSRSTPPTWWWPPWPRWPPSAGASPSEVSAAIAAYGIDPEAATPFSA